ncbi:MAG: carbamoyltransferase HypF [Bacteroidales bacterium]|nr:carbamoyltransferase HypF [Bacteroidales bacterium]
MVITSCKIQIKGLVQGVGFRPFIYRLAKEYNLTGWVQNTTHQVIVRVEGERKSLQNFIKNIQIKAPAAANIESVEVTDEKIASFKEFSIRKSHDTSDEITEISPDIAVCDDCLHDLKIQKHRIDYPFINCTNCGPRFTIIKDLPYDRDKTTMDVFKMCDICKNEYENINNRRFHAQPVACNNCGPQYELRISNNRITNIELVIKETAQLIEKGEIIALKGQGGFHLACDALNEEAVNYLRKSKHREGKPFAVMFKNLNCLKKYAFVTKEEEKSLLSWQRPIVILKEKLKLAASVSNGFNTIGAMLPYMPFHYLLFEKLLTPVIVLTSGNISDEPIVIANTKALDTFNSFSSGFITYNRDIFNRTDDSVCMLVNNKERIIRRSRGYVPKPVKTTLNVEGIFAAGAELTNCFAIGRGNQAILSQHIGDLKNFETYEFYTESYNRFKRLFRVNPCLVACDMHPDYLSTRFARELDLPVTEVQHHHAHIASVMAEYGLDEKVIGIGFDGTGYGTDGNIWGSEFLICDLKDFKRYTHFSYIPLPGGDAVVKEPWRIGLVYLYKIYKDEVFNLDIPFIRNLDKSKVVTIISAIKNNINTPLSCSAGRVFDAVAVITGICSKTLFHAEAPMRLENIIDNKIVDEYPFDIKEEVNLQSVFKGIVEDLKRNIAASAISAKFHNTINSIIFTVVKNIKNETGINKIVLSGGTFQNKYLSEKIENRLIKNKFNIFVPRQIPANDGGIALGQLAIAAKRREESCV